MTATDVSPVGSALNVLMPTDAFPPECGGAGWSAHALALSLIASGHRVTAIVPRVLPRHGAGPQVSQRRSVGVATDVLGVPTIEAPYLVPGLPFVANWFRHEWLWPTFRNLLVREALRPLAGQNPAGVAGRTVIHAQHVQSVPAAVLAGRELQVPVLATVRDHWPRDYFATGLHGGAVPYPRNTAASLATDLVSREGPLWGSLASIAIPYMLAHMRRRQAFLHKADAVVAVSSYMAGHLATLVESKKLHVIPNMVDVDAIQQVASSPPAFSIDQPFLLYVGKLERNKGAHLLPSILAAARDALGDAPLPPLVVAGSGALAEELHRKMGRGGTLLNAGDWLSHDEVLRLMRRAEVLLFPSTWGDPLSRVLLEASAAGACIAAMRTGGTPEVVVDGISGVLTTEATELGHVVADLLRDPERRQRLRLGAQARAREQWATAVVTRKVEALYQQLLQAGISAS